jgi:hypothetical protein
VIGGGGIIDYAGSVPGLGETGIFKEEEFGFLGEGDNQGFRGNDTGHRKPGRCRPLQPSTSRVPCGVFCILVMIEPSAMPVLK